MMSIDINIIAISNVHGVGYNRVIADISKSEAVNILRISDLIEKSKSL